VRLLSTRSGEGKVEQGPREGFVPFLCVWASLKGFFPSVWLFQRKLGSDVFFFFFDACLMFSIDRH